MRARGTSAMLRLLGRLASAMGKGLWARSLREIADGSGNGLGGPRRNAAAVLPAILAAVGLVLSVSALHAQLYAQPLRPAVPPGAPGPVVPGPAPVPGAPAPGPGGAPGPGPRVIQLTPVQLSGTVVAVRPGMILVDTPAQDRWALQLQGDTVVRVTGTAVPEVLRPGLFVRFLVRVDERRTRALSKVRRLVIITPANMDGREPGVFPAQLDAQAPQQPGGEGPEQGGEDQPGARADLPGDIYDVRARISEIKGRWMTVYAPNTFFDAELRVELDRELAVMLDVGAYGLARPGDRFAAVALQVGPKAAIAREVSIALTDPVGQQPTKNGRRPPHTEQPGAEQPGQPGAPQPGGVAQAPGPQGPGQGELPGAEVPGVGAAGEQTEAAKKAMQIVELLRLKPEELQGKAGLQVGLGGDEPVVFLPARPEAVKTIRDRFGPPDRLQAASGTLAVGEGGQPVEVHWNLWTYGPLRFFVDEVGTVRYYVLGEPQAEDAEPGEDDAAQPDPPAAGQ